MDPNMNATPRLSQIWAFFPIFTQGVFHFRGQTGFIVLSRAFMSFPGKLGHLDFRRFKKISSQKLL